MIKNEGIKFIRGNILVDEEKREEYAVIHGQLFDKNVAVDTATREFDELFNMIVKDIKKYWNYET